MGRPHAGHARPSASNTLHNKSLQGIHGERLGPTSDGGSNGRRAGVGTGAGTTLRRIGDPDRIPSLTIRASVVSEIAAVALAEGDLALGEQRRREVVRLRERLGHANVWSTLCSLAEVIADRGRPDEALAMATTARAGLQALGDERGLAMVLLLLARLAAQRAAWPELAELADELTVPAGIDASALRSAATLAESAGRSVLAARLRSLLAAASLEPSPGAPSRYLSLHRCRTTADRAPAGRSRHNAARG